VVGDALDALLSRELEAHSLEFRLRRRLIAQEVGILNGLASSRIIDAIVAHGKLFPFPQQHSNSAQHSALEELEA